MGKYSERCKRTVVSLNSVQARLPDPDKEKDEGKKKIMERLKALVEKHMVHTPCEGDDEAYCR